MVELIITLGSYYTYTEPSGKKWCVKVLQFMFNRMEHWKTAPFHREVSYYQVQLRQTKTNPYPFVVRASSLSPLMRQKRSLQLEMPI